MAGLVPRLRLHEKEKAALSPREGLGGRKSTAQKIIEDIEGLEEARTLTPFASTVETLRGTRKNSARDAAAHTPDRPASPDLDAEMQTGGSFLLSPDQKPAKADPRRNPASEPERTDAEHRPNGSSSSPAARGHSRPLEEGDEEEGRRQRQGHSRFSLSGGREDAERTLDPRVSGGGGCWPAAEEQPRGVRLPAAYRNPGAESDESCATLAGVAAALSELSPREERLLQQQGITDASQIVHLSEAQLARMGLPPPCARRLMRAAGKPFANQRQDSVAETDYVRLIESITSAMQHLARQNAELKETCSELHGKLRHVEKEFQTDRAEWGREVAHLQHRIRELEG
ncbi:hypothetical protein DIPPA_26442 [Diplonema papillatum]|nr:hypothetical protein DIPPA_26442 [Diplonema papillatum]